MAEEDVSPDQADTDASHVSQGVYAVGYGKPPVHSRFKRGHSGNPKGGAKARRSLNEVVKAAFYEKVSVQTPRGVRKMTKIDALVQKVLNDALRGDAKAVQQVVRLARDAGLNEEVEVLESAMGALNEEDRQILNRFDSPVQEGDRAEPVDP